MVESKVGEHFLWGLYVNLGCYHKNTETRWLTNNKNVFLTVVKAKVQGQGVSTVGVW